MGERALGLRGFYSLPVVEGSRCALWAMLALAVLFGATRAGRAEPIDAAAPNAPEFGDLLDAEGIDHLDEGISHLDVFEATDPTPAATDDAGELAGELADDGDDLSLIPEPATLAMLGVALLLLFLWRRKW